MSKFKVGDRVKVHCRGSVETEGVATVVPYDSKGFYDYRVQYPAGWHGVCYEDELTLVEEATSRTPLVTRTYTIRKDGKGIGLTEEQAQQLYNDLHELLP